MHHDSTPDVVECVTCGRLIRIPPSKRGRTRYCSRTCRFQAAVDAIPHRFWSQVDKSGGPNACWEWTGSLRNGYGQMSYLDGGKTRNEGTHRVAWRLTNGPIPDGMFVCHACDNPPCCNPSHLFLGTALDNNRDANRKGRHPHDAAWNPAGEVNPKAKMTDAQVIEARRRWAAGGVSKSQLAREYGVSSTMMSWIILHRHWTHLPSVDDLKQQGS